MIQSYGTPSNQQGSTLLVSIIMIFMMSILGVSVMRGSTIERRMADNAVITNKNFQIAESSTEMALNNFDSLTQAYANDGDAHQVSTTIHGDTNVNSWAELRFVGIGPATGYSLSEGNGSTFVNARFVATGNSQSASVRAVSQIQQGASRVIPAGDD